MRSSCGQCSRQRTRRHVVLDLADVMLVDRDAVRFLAGIEAEGAVLVNCPEYVRSLDRR